jgi:acyl-CoA thioesterase-1
MTNFMRKYCSPRKASALLSAACASLLQIGAAAPPTILVMGDSLSAAYGIASDEGWVSLLQQRLKARDYDFRVINASISGETTSGGLARLPQALTRYRPDLVIIELGANDGLRGIDPAQIHQNLTRMINLSHRRGAEVLLTGVQIPANYGDTFRQRYFAVYDGVAEQTDTALLNSFLQGVAQRPDLMQEDGLHPNAQAQPAILANVWPKLKPLIEQFDNS